MTWVILYYITVFTAAFLDTLNRIISKSNGESKLAPMTWMTLFVFMTPVLNVLDAGVSLGAIIGRRMK